MYFVGLDLAWSEKNGSSIAIIKGDNYKAELISTKIVNSDSEIIEYIKKHVHNSALIAIDAPLIVKNEQGRKDAEKLIEKLFRKNIAEENNASKERLTYWTKNSRGEKIVNMLEIENYIHSPDIKRFEEKKKVFEVFAEISTVALFNSDNKSEHRMGFENSNDFSYKEFIKYQNNLKKLSEADPKLLVGEIADKDVTKFKPKELKSYSSTLEAIFCAYIAYYAWKFPARCAVIGDLSHGYIMTPINDAIRKNINSLGKQKSLGEF